MPRLVTLSHEFLRSFCRNSKENQVRLAAHISPTEGGTESAMTVKEGSRSLGVETVSDQN